MARQPKYTSIETIEELLKKAGSLDGSGCGNISTSARGSKIISEPLPCHRCGTFTPLPPLGKAFIGRDIDGLVLCADCRKIFADDRRLFFHEEGKWHG